MKMNSFAPMATRYFVIILLLASLATTFLICEAEINKIKRFAEEQVVLQHNNIILQVAQPMHFGDSFKLWRDILKVKELSLESTLVDDHINIVRSIAIVDLDNKVMAHTDIEQYPIGKAYQGRLQREGSGARSEHKNYRDKLTWHGQNSLARLNATGKVIYNEEEIGSVILEVDTTHVLKNYHMLSLKYITFGLLFTSAILMFWYWIEERNKAEEALRANEKKYRTLLENLPQRIFLKDKNSIYISCNSNYAGDLGIEPNDIVGKSDYDFFPKELADKYRGDDQKIRETGLLEDIVESYVQNGKDKYIHIIKVPIEADEGGHNLLGLFWDITDEKIAEEKVEKAYEELLEKSERLERFHQLTVGRELEMIRLKEEINDLLEEAGESGRYEVPAKVQNIH